MAGSGRVGVARRALASRPLRRVLLAFVVFNTAEWAVWIALLVWAYGHGGGRASALIGVVQLAPAVVVAPFASVLGDRWPRTRALTTGYLLQALTLLVTAATLAAGAPFFVVAAAAAVMTCTVTLTRPVHYSLMPLLADNPGELVAANAASTTVEGIGAVAGPAVCAGLIAVAGAASVLAVFGVLTLVAAALAAPLRATDTVPAAPVSGLVAETLDGARALVQCAPAALLTGLVTVEFLVVGALDILVVGLALSVLDTGDGGPGLLMAVFGLGGLAGALGTVVLVGRPRLVPALGGAVLGIGLPLALVSLAPGVVVVAVLLTTYGVGKAFFDVTNRSLLQRTVPDRVLSRVFGLEEAMLNAGTALGNAVAPLLVLWFGLRGAFVSVGLLLPVVSALTWRWLRDLDRLAQVPSEGLALLRRVPMFVGLPPDRLERLALDLVEVRVAPGAAVVRQGERGDRFYVIEKGRAEVQVDGRTVRTLEPGDGFGEIALLRHVPRTATVLARSPLVVHALPREGFLLALHGEARSTADRVADHHLADDRARRTAD